MTMKDKSVKTQPATITLSRKSTTATLYTWEAAQNPISELKLRKIYTNVELTGTKTNPKQHNVTLALTGGGISSRSLGFDKLLVKQITINGDMYEDDHTG